MADTGRNRGGGAFSLGWGVVPVRNAACYVLCPRFTPVWAEKALYLADSNTAKRC